MRYEHIPSTDFKLSVLCLGTACFGSSIPADEAWRMMDIFAEQGGNFLDTAYVYASWLPNGEGASERTIGKWMVSRGNRKRMIIGTKGCSLDLTTLCAPEFSPDRIAAELGESLDRLHTDYVDIYWLHRDNPAVPVGEILGVFSNYVTSGQIRALAASNWTTARLQEAADYSHAHGLTGFRASQIGWSLAEVPSGAGVDPTALNMDAPMLEYHRRSGFPVVAYSSQAQVFFAGKGDRREASSSASVYFTEENFARLDRAHLLARKHGVSPNHIALGYVISHSFPGFAIIGPREPAQLENSLVAGNIMLSGNEVAYLDGCSRAN